MWVCNKTYTFSHSNSQCRVREKAIQRHLAGNLEMTVVTKTLFVLRESANVILDTTPKKDNVVS